MFKRWPVRKPTDFRFPTVEAPEELVNYDTVRVTLRVEPVRNGVAVARVHGSVDVSVLEIDASDQRALIFLMRRLLRDVLREYFGQGLEV